MRVGSGERGSKGGQGRRELMYILAREKRVIFNLPGLGKVHFTVSQLL